MTDNLTHELIKAQATERMAQADYTRALTVLQNARENVREIEFEIAKRIFAAAGFVAGSTVFRDTQHNTGREYLFAGAGPKSGSGHTVYVRKKTKTGNWFKNTTELYSVKPSDLEILRHE